LQKAQAAWRAVKVFARRRWLKFSRPTVMRVFRGALLFFFIYDVNKLSYKALLPVVQLAPLLDELALFCRKSHLIIHI
jgi:hypothetical protein